MQLSRRRALSAAAVSAAGLVGITAARADDGGVSERSNVGHYHTTVGGLDVTLLTDGTFNFDPMHPTLGGNVSAEQFDATVREYHAAADGLAHVHGLLVRGNDRTVLIDAGSGDTFVPTCGRLVANLRAAGVEPGDVTDVLLTHAHLDHIGGLIPTGGAAGPVFPNAAVHITETEHDFWRGKPTLPDMAVPEEMKTLTVDVADRGLDAAGDRLTMIAAGEDADVLPGIAALPTPGHTPGHVAFRVSDGGEELVFVGDTIFFVPVIPAHPDWHIAFDADRVEAAATRFRFMDRLASDRLRICGPHLPFPALGHLRRAGAGFEYLPEIWRW